MKVPLSDPIHILVLYYFLPVFWGAFQVKILHI